MKIPTWFSYSFKKPFKTQKPGSLDFSRFPGKKPPVFREKSSKYGWCPSGANDVTRTHDLLITNQLLYRLSYISLSLWSAWISPERELFYHSFLLPSTGYFQFPQAVFIRRFLYNTICILQEVLQNFSLPFALFSERSLECIGFCQENLLGFTQEISTISVIIFCWLPLSPSPPPRFSFT